MNKQRELTKEEFYRLGGLKNRDLYTIEENGRIRYYKLIDWLTK